MDILQSKKYYFAVGIIFPLLFFANSLIYNDHKYQSLDDKFMQITSGKKKKLKKNLFYCFGHYCNNCIYRNQTVSSVWREFHTISLMYICEIAPCKQYLIWCGQAGSPYRVEELEVWDGKSGYIYFIPPKISYNLISISICVATLPYPAWLRWGRPASSCRTNQSTLLFLKKEPGWIIS